MKPFRSPEYVQDNAVQKYVFPEMTYKFFPTGGPPHHLKLVKGLVIMIIPKMLQSDSSDCPDVSCESARQESGTTHNCGHLQRGVGHILPSSN